MRCANCGSEVEEGLASCASCGQLVEREAQPEPGAPRETTRDELVGLDFTGPPLELFGWAVLSMLAALVVIPLAWVTAAVARWFCRHTAFSDGTTVRFRGTGDQVLIWHIFYVLAIVGQTYLMQQVAGEGFLVVMGVLVASFVVIVGIVLTVLRWLFFNLELSSGPPLTFTGSYLGLLGWYLLAAVSIYTIVGWAWVVAAMYRWIASHVKGRGAAFEFRGRGHEILWRTLVAALGCMLIVPIPWAAQWLTRWLIQQLALNRRPENDLASLSEPALV